MYRTTFLRLALGGCLLSCVGGLAPLTASEADAGRTDAGAIELPDTSVKEDTAPAVDAGPAEPPPFSAPSLVELRDSLNIVESLDITEPWFGSSGEFYFRSDVMVKECMQIACDSNWRSCRYGSMLQFFARNNPMRRPATFGVAETTGGGPIAYDDGRDILRYRGSRPSLTLREAALYPYVFPGSTNVTAVEQGRLKAYSLKNNVLEPAADWGAFDGSYHAADSFDAPTIVVYTTAAGGASARVRSNDGVWTEAPSFMKNLSALSDIRMTWISADGRRIVFSALDVDSKRSKMYTATR